MTATLDNTLSIGDLAAAHPGYIVVFDRFGLEYCCHGGRPLSESRAAAGISIADVLVALRTESTEGPGVQADDYRSLTMTALADHIEAVHDRSNESSD